MNQDKPIILWTADVKGWAYFNRIITMSRAMPQYHHAKLMGDCVPACLWKTLGDQASVIVCQGIKWPERLSNAGIDIRKMILRLDSIRIDLNGVYHDIFVPAAAATGQ